MAKTELKTRKIRIKSDFLTKVCNLFNHFSTQLSDGYWENSRGEWGSYGDGYYEGIWNCFDFDTEHNIVDRNKDYFVITLKNKPTWEDAKEDCAKYHKMSDREIVDYLKEALFDSMDDVPQAFDFAFSEYELKILRECIENWEILPPPLPKMTHKELVSIVGHDFEYVKK